MKHLAALLVLGLGLVAPPARAGELPIFDAHVHYSDGAWGAFPPALVIGLMDAAGVAKALVSSSPDDGTQTLLDAAPGRILGGFRPYRDSNDLWDWHESAELLAYSEERLAAGRHVVFGEIHMAGPEAAAQPGLARYVELIRRRGLMLHVHADAAVVEALYARWPGLRVLWAHAGMSEPAAVVGGVLDRHPNVWTELSYRARDVMPGAVIDAEWRALLIRHADRFLVGTDTWEPGRWFQYKALIQAHRAYLEALPAEVAAKIAHKNAEKLFGPGP